MSRPLKTIVIATSLTDASDAVVRIGRALARTTGASPWLVHSYFPYLPLTFPSGGGVDARWTEEQVKGLRELMSEQARRTGLSTLADFSPDQIRLAVGSPHRQIVELARRVEAGLIVVGAADTGRSILGSTAERVIRKSPCPVLAVRSEAAFPPTRTEIPVDLSPASANALRQGLVFLAQLGVRLDETEALFVLNPFEVGSSIQFTPEQIERFAGEELHRFLCANADQSAPLQAAQVRTGYPCEEILARIAERRADLAVLGTHGRGGFERFVIGSVAAGVLHGASCNLLVVPPETSQSYDAATEHTEEPAGADWGYVSDEAPDAAVQASPSESPGEYWFG